MKEKILTDQGQLSVLVTLLPTSKGISAESIAHVNIELLSRLLEIPNDAYLILSQFWLFAQ